MRDLFINKFINSITAAKKRKVIDIINRRKGDAEKSISAISKEITKALNDIDTSNDSPLSTPIGFVDEAVIDSSYMQKYMMDIADDVLVLMTAMQSIELLNRSHSTLFNKFLFSGIESSIRQIKKRLNAAKLIKHGHIIGATSYRQQDSVFYKQYPSMSETKLIYDKQKGKNFTEKEILSFDAYGSLMLPLLSLTAINDDIADVYKKFPESSTGEKEIIVDGSDIGNVIDLDNATFYREVSLLSNEIDGGYVMCVAIDIDYQAKINRLVITPFGDSKMRIRRIFYDNRNALTPTYNNDIVPYDQDIYVSDIRDKTIINFDTVVATNVYVEFVQKTYSVINFDDSLESINLARQNMSNNTYIVNADYLKELLPPFVDSNAVSEKYYSYETAIADIDVSYVSYRDSGVYVFDKEVFENVLQIGINSDVQIGTNVQENEYSVEYYISASVSTEGGKPTVFTAQVPLINASKIKQIYYNDDIVLDYDVDDISNISISTTFGLIPQTEYSLYGKTVMLSTSVSGNAPYIVEYSPSFITSPEKRFTFSDSGILAEDIDRNGEVGLDEDGMIALFSPVNEVEIEYSVVIRDLVGTSFIKVSNVNIVYNSYDKNKYRF